ncbi:hypothetical protein H6P81_004397 [Aristolochia fimbriata]|uniref:Nitronate monooxygenase domain-containing protein n=1 Tax=Aristolochia fimbriata TaxID=158543 RepID=A0AAV7FGV3_ARIFI|nr:hypothetical protein H6P81_004397 [Aristolochia fimbriata]
MVKFGGILGFDNGIMLATMGPDVSGTKLVAAVANAGGIASLAVPPNNYDLTKKTIAETRKLTTKPFGAGVLLAFPQTESIRAILEAKLAFLQVFWGDYPKEMVDEAHKAGVKVFHQVGSVEDAEKAVAAGVDVIMAQGVEAGGHILGTVAVTALVPRVVDVIGDKKTIVIAAGSMSDPRCYAAALALGAQGICLGTRFLASEEAYANDYYKQQLVAYANDYYKQQLVAYTEGQTWRSDLYGRASWRAYARLLDTPFNQKWHDAPSWIQNDDSQPIIGQTVIWGTKSDLRRFAGQAPNPTTTGKLDEMVLYAGEGVGYVNSILPAAEIVKRMAEGVQTVIKGLKSKFSVEEADDARQKTSWVKI